MHRKQILSKPVNVAELAKVLERDFAAQQNNREEQTEE